MGEGSFAGILEKEVQLSQLILINWFRRLDKSLGQHAQQRAHQLLDAPLISADGGGLPGHIAVHQNPHSDADAHQSELIKYGG